MPDRHAQRWEGVLGFRAFWGFRVRSATSSRRRRTNLEKVANVDVKCGGVRRHGDPIRLMFVRRGRQSDLQAVHVVRPQNAQQLRVGVLSEPDPHAARSVADDLAVVHQLGEGGRRPVIGRPGQARGNRIMVEPDQGVIVSVLEHPTEDSGVLQPQSLREHLQQLDRQLLHLLHVFVHHLTAIVIGFSKTKTKTVVMDHGILLNA